MASLEFPSAASFLSSTNSMPKFLEEKLEKEYGDNPHAIYGTMNKIGAMKGNKETVKGRAMERKHTLARKLTSNKH
jgi:hypothetical protein